MAVVKTLIGNVKGPQGDKGDKGTKGDKGATGSRGSRWTEGTAITGTSTTPTVFSGSGITDALADDQYLNTTTGNVYRCTTGGAANVAKWVYACNLKGLKGDPGAKGDPGLKGDQGDKGDKGDTPTVADNMTVAFTQASSRANIATGEKMSTIMGKIKKFFADLTAPAFAQMITTKDDLLATKATGYVPDAKAVADAVTDVTSKLSDLISVTMKNAFEAASGVTLSNDYFIFYKRGNTISVQLQFAGSITTGSDGRVKIGSVKSPYIPSAYQCCMTRINKNTSGQVYSPALITVSTNGDVNLITGESNKTYGNASYPWSTTGAMNFSYSL